MKFFKIQIIFQFFNIFLEMNFDFLRGGQVVAVKFK